MITFLGPARRPHGVATARVLFDGTNGIEANKKTRVRDQERAPVASDLKLVMRENAKRGERTLALVADVSEAHLEIRIAPTDWHVLRCQVRPAGPVFLCRLGTFGFAAASHHRSRLAGASHSISWDLQPQSGIKSSRTIIISKREGRRIAPHSSSSVCSVQRQACLYRCPRTARGDLISRVGFEVIHSSHKLGVSLRSAE